MDCTEQLNRAHTGGLPSHEMRPPGFGQMQLSWPPSFHTQPRGLLENPSFHFYLSCALESPQVPLLPGGPDHSSLRLPPSLCLWSWHGKALFI